MHKTLLTLIAIGVLVASVAPLASADTAEQLASQATQALAAKDYAQAERYLSQWQSQYSPLPESFQFLYGFSLFQQQKFDQAKPALDKYLSQYAANGKYSVQVQQLLEKFPKQDDIEMVQLPNGLLMGKYEVTQGQWQKIMGSNPSKFSACGDSCPVERVSWDDVQVFISKLNSQAGKRYRLPTEDEWFNACQAGTSTEYCGSSSIDAVAWYDGNSGDTTHAVGQKQANAYGLYDMSGNVWEWTDSCYENDCSQRVDSGGSWHFEPALVRSAFRIWYTSTDRSSDLGFRLAQDR